MAKKKRGRGRPPGSKTKKPNAKPTGPKKKAASNRALYQSKIKNVLPDLVNGRFCVACERPATEEAPSKVLFLTASGEFSENINEIMAYGSREDAEAVLGNFMRALERATAPDATEEEKHTRVDPIAAGAEAVAFKKYLATSYSINSTTNAVSGVLARKEDAVSFKAAVREIKKQIEGHIKTIKQSHKLLIAEAKSRVEACEEELYDVENSMKHFEKQMASYG